MNRLAIPLRVLLVEDSENDARLVLHALEGGGYDVHFKRVDSADSLREALAGERWDIMLVDHNMPGFDSRAALEMRRLYDVDLPSIIVSGVIGEIAAVEAMRAGAADYVMKGNLSRLLPAVQRELQDARVRVQHRQAEEALLASEDRYQQLFEANPLPLWAYDLETLSFLDVNDAACRNYGYTREEFLALTIRDIRPEEDVYRLDNSRQVMDSATRNLGIWRHRLKDGTTIDVDVVAHETTLHGRRARLVCPIDITERLAAEKALRESEARFRSLSALSSDWYWEQDEDYRFVELGASSGKPHLRPPGFVGKTRWDNLTGNLTAAQWAEHRAVLDARRPFYDFQYSREGVDGERRWVSISGEPVFDIAGKFTGYRGVGKDITERKRAEVRISRLNRVYAVLSGINSLIVRVRDRDELFREACRVVVEDGKFTRAWIGTVERETKHVSLVVSCGVDAKFVEGVVAKLNDPKFAGQGIVSPAISTLRPAFSNDVARDPRVVDKKHALSPGSRSIAALPLLTGGTIAGVLVLHSGEPGFFDADEMKLLTELAGDISFALEHLEKSEKLDYLAYYDELTGLANRALFNERLDQHLMEARKSGGMVALLLMNVARFKMVNDALGRQAGDELLRQIAGRALNVMGGPARLARIGGDLFGVMTFGLKSAEEMARRTEQRFDEIFGEPYVLGGTELKVSARFGIAMFPDDGADAETLFRNAEAALKKTKVRGEKYLFYMQKMNRKVAENLHLENNLRQAIEKQEFVLHYQPKVDLETRAISGVEALIRWQSPELGLVPPLKFIPLLEETGLILPVGAWALRQAMRDHKDWVARGLAAPRVAVNVSPIQLRRLDFVASLVEAIKEGASPHGLDLEITESLIMEDIEGSIEKLKAARELGIQISIDDFGTGYSSLAYLAKLPVQTLKIDRAFIITMLTDPNVTTLVQTMISLAHSLRLKVVAEGVEEEDQANMLRLLRCEQMQGYLFSKPLPVAELQKLLQKPA